MCGNALGGRGGVVKASGELRLELLPEPLDVVGADVGP
jgi:hypothetical protein